MTLFEGEQNGRYETDHLHMVLNEHIDFTEEGLSDDRKYSIFVHEYVHYYQHFATLYGSQFCKMANLLFIETRATHLMVHIQKMPTFMFLMLPLTVIRQLHLGAVLERL